MARWPRLLSLAALAALLVLTPLALAARGDMVLVNRANGASGAAAISSGYSSSMSAGGRYVAFESDDDNLSSEDDNMFINIFLRDVEGGTTALISRANGPNGTGADGISLVTSTRLVSGDGRFVAFESQGDNLSPDDVDMWTNVFVRDTQAGTTTLVSHAAGVGANDHSFGPAISADGRHVAFASEADNLSPDDNNSVRNVFVRDLQTGTLTWVSRGDGPVGGAASDQSSSPSLSGDGRYVEFTSLADNLSAEDNPALLDIFVRDLQTHALKLASRATGANGAAGNAHSDDATISDDGLHVAFTSRSTNLSPDATTPIDQIFVRDLQANTTALVSRANGPTGAAGNGSSSYATISADGRYVGFEGSSNNLVPDDPNTGSDVFVRDVQTGATFLVSRAPGQTGAIGDFPSYSPAISRDGRYVAFGSDADNFSADDNNAYVNVFRRDILGTPPRCSDVAQAVAHNAAVTIQLACTDDDGDAPTRSIVSGPAHGTLGPIDQSAGTVSYTPTRGYSGPDSFSFRAGDATGPGGTATATLTVAAAPPVPKPKLRPGRCANLKRGTNRANRLNGTNAGDRILGLGGNDRINGLRGADCLLGGAGRDRISGGYGDDRLEGGTGNDTLIGGRGRNAYLGGSGRDVISAANGVRELINCGSGRDRVTADRGDRVRRCESVRRVRRR